MLLNVAEAAERAKVSKTLIRRWTTVEKRLPHFRLGGRGKRGKLVIDSVDLDMFLDTLKIPTKDEKNIRTRNLKVLRLR